MAKAEITLPDGTKMRLDGTPEEITAVVERWQDKVRGRNSGSRRVRVQLVDLIGNLIDGGFFKKPKDLAAVKSALEEMGHHYPLTTLSGTMLSQVRRRSLRRLKQAKRWMYTQ